MRAIHRSPAYELSNQLCFQEMFQTFTTRSINVDSVTQKDKILIIYKEVLKVQDCECQDHCTKSILHLQQ